MARAGLVLLLALLGLACHSVGKSSAVAVSSAPRATDLARSTDAAQRRLCTPLTAAQLAAAVPLTVSHEDLATGYGRILIAGSLTETGGVLLDSQDCEVIKNERLSEAEASARDAADALPEARGSELLRVELVDAVGSTGAYAVPYQPLTVADGPGSGVSYEFTLLVRPELKAIRVWLRNGVIAEYVRSAAPIALEALRLETSPMRIALRWLGAQTNLANLEVFLQVNGVVQQYPFHVGALLPAPHAAAEPCWLVVEDRNMRRGPAGSSALFKLFDAFNRWSFLTEGS